jgi:hypothetical protein
MCGSGRAGADHGHGHGHSRGRGPNFGIYKRDDLVRAYGSTGGWWRARVVYHDPEAGCVRLRWEPTNKYWESYEETVEEWAVYHLRETARRADAAGRTWDSARSRRPGSSRGLKPRPALPPAEPSSPPVPFEEGEEVVARGSRDGGWYRAHVVEPTTLAEPAARGRARQCRQALVRLRFAPVPDRGWGELKEAVPASAIYRAVTSRFLGSPLLTPPDLEAFEAVVGDPGWLSQALKRFRYHGFVVLRNCIGRGQCKRLYAACREAEAEIIKRCPSGNRGPSRWSFAVASRTGSMLHEPAWVELLDSVPLLQLLDGILPEGGECVSGGGDFVFGGAAEFQRIHSDIDVASAQDLAFPPPYVSANFAVHEVDAFNGPMRIIPGTQRMSGRARRENLTLPQLHEEPEEWLGSTLQPLCPGDVIVRDVRVLHGGTPNLTAETRFLPSLEFASAALRESKRQDIWPVPVSLPEEVFSRLSPWAQAWCSERVAPASAISTGWW